MKIKTESFQPILGKSTTEMQVILNLIVGTGSCLPLFYITFSFYSNQEVFEK